jgi:hypothetical protein
MKIIFAILFILILVTSKQDSIKKSDSVIHHYLQTTFNINPKGSEKFLFFNCRGCMTCEENGFRMINEQKELLSSFKNVIVSKQFLSQIGEEDKILSKKILVDNDDILEKINLPLGGLLSVRFENGNIKSICNLTPDNLDNGKLIAFFAK